MSSGLDSTLDLSSPTNWILILCHLSCDSALNLLCEKIPSIRTNRIRLLNRYYDAYIPIQIQTMAHLSSLLSDPGFVRSLQFVPAVVILSTVRGDISECQRVWNNIKNSIREDAARALLLLEGLPDGENQELIKWAVANEIEIVPQDNCKSDSMSQELLEILACAPWRMQSKLSKPTPSRADVSERSNTKVEELKQQTEKEQNLSTQEELSASEDVSSDRTLLNLSKETRLRRGLVAKDISNILSELLLVESDSDDVE